MSPFVRDYKGQAVDVKQVARELGVRYVLEGSVRKGGSRMRITAQSIDANSGAHLWADRFDGSLEKDLRPSGQGGLQRRRRHRTDFAGGRDSQVEQTPNI